MKKLFQKIGGFFKRVFGGKKLLQYAGGAVGVVDLLIKVINSPLTNYAVAIVPIPGDDMILAAAKKALPIASQILHGLITNSSEEKSPAEWVAWVADEIKTIDPEFRDERVKKLQELIVYVLADGKITEDEAAQILAQYKKDFLDKNISGDGK